MTESEKQAYDKLIADLELKTKSFSKKATQEEVAPILEQLEALKKQIADLVKAQPTAEEAKAEEEEEEAVKSAITNLEKKMAAMLEQPATKGYKSIKSALTAAFAEKKNEIDLIVKGDQKASLRLTLKEVVPMQVDNTIGAGSTQVSITENTGIISPIRKREMTYLANVSVGSIAGNRAMWVEETTEEGTPIMLGEGDAKTQLSALYVEQTMTVKKIAVYGKVTTEMLADLPQLISYIENNLMKRMDIVIENQLISGGGTGDNLKGAEEYATAFAAGDLAETIEGANEYDVIAAVANQSTIAHGMPNAIMVHPTTLAKMKMLKGQDGQYLMPLFATANGLEIAGMKVIPTVAITAGEFLGGDFSVINVLNRDELSLTIGLDGNDFTQNKKTMLAERRLVQFVSANDTAVIIKGDFASAKEDLELISL